MCRKRLFGSICFYYRILYQINEIHLQFFIQLIFAQHESCVVVNRSACARDASMASTSYTTYTSGVLSAHAHTNTIPSDAFRNSTVALQSQKTNRILMPYNTAVAKL